MTQNWQEHNEYMRDDYCDLLWSQGSPHLRQTVRELHITQSYIIPYQTYKKPSERGLFSTSMEYESIMKGLVSMGVWCVCVCEAIGTAVLATRLEYRS